MTTTPSKRGGPRTPGTGKRLGRKPKPLSEKLVRRPVGMLPRQWAWLRRRARAQKTSTDAVLREMVDREIHRTKVTVYTGDGGY